MTNPTPETAPTPQSLNPVGASRAHAQLRRELGIVADLLFEPNVTEVMLNPDGRLWMEKLGQPIVEVGALDEVQATKLLRTVANMVGMALNEHSPTIACSLPLDGSRFQGWMPPVVQRPGFNIRKPASLVFPLEIYVENNVVKPHQAKFLEEAVLARKNIVVAGGTGSGKTTFCNAVLDTMAKVDPTTRVFIIEDTRELQCNIANKFSTLTVRERGIDMHHLLFTALRARPDRILVGEVRDGAALALIDAWGTGHPGGVATLHANTAERVLRRLEAMVRMANVPPDPETIADAVNVVAYIERTPEGRRLTSLIEVQGYDRAEGKYITREV